MDRIRPGVPQPGAGLGLEPSPAGGQPAAAMADAAAATASVAQPAIEQSGRRDTVESPQRWNCIQIVAGALQCVIGSIVLGIHWVCSQFACLVARCCCISCCKDGEGWVDQNLFSQRPTGMPQSSGAV